MTYVSGFIRQQGLNILANHRYAMLCAVLFAVIPYTTWLSLAIISLVTLKKGWRDGALLLMPVLTAYFACSLSSVPTQAAIINALLTFMPCYLATCVLGITASWRAVASVLFLLVLLGAMLLQIFMPEFITAQYQYLVVLIREMRPDLLPKFVKDTGGLNQQILANYLLGLQLACLVFSTLLPLMLARSMQSQLYYPGGFRQEMLTLRGNKIGLLVLVLMLIAANLNNMIAMNILPLLVFYFLIAGLSLGLQALIKKKIRGAFILLIAPVLLVPFIMLPAYVILGSLDSLFNLRLYLLSRAGKTT